MRRPSVFSVAVASLLLAGIALVGCGSTDDKTAQLPERQFRLDDLALGRAASRTARPTAAGEVLPALRQIAGRRVGFGSCRVRAYPEESDGGVVGVDRVFCHAGDGLGLAQDAYRYAVAGVTAIRTRTPKDPERLGCRTINPGQRRCTISYPVADGHTVLYVYGVARTDTAAGALARTVRDLTIQRLAARVGPA